ncbi:hypothetical protein QYE76_039558 [Lolium multiflorum]|uniref:TF-B3 domain-containing protein n=1 Tax=Lolium multiflorum TaxID=4521 RepID=A0AAD8T9K4_LOLMU|nr:hypothetical protein QYE76_039558 [Lolium multiflorum]
MDGETLLVDGEALAVMAVKISSNSPSNPISSPKGASEAGRGHTIGPRGPQAAPPYGVGPSGLHLLRPSGSVNILTEKLKLGSPTETTDEGPSKKRRAANVGHFQDEVGPDHFLRIVFRPTHGQFLIPQDFVKWFGEIPSTIIVRTNTGCSWRMTTMREGDDAYIDQRWAGFAIAHQLKVGQFLTFKKVSSFEYSVVILDHTYTEVMSRCPYHGNATRCVVFENHVWSLPGIVSLLPCRV